MIGLYAIAAVPGDWMLARIIKRLLTGHGWRLTHDWTEVAEAGGGATNGAVDARRFGVVDADLTLVLVPEPGADRSDLAWVEAGYALANGRRIILCGKAAAACSYASLAERCFASLGDAISYLVDEAGEEDGPPTVRRSYPVTQDLLSGLEAETTGGAA